MTFRLPGYIKGLLTFLLILAVFSPLAFSQTKINGIVNKYARVTGIGADFVVISDETQFQQFAAGDTVLLIQMKGVRVYSTEDASFGTPEATYGPSGKSEFLTVLSVDDPTNTITFRNNIVNSTFNVEGRLQLIKVPSYNYAMVDGGILTCQPWDSVTKTGGVLAVIAGRALSLNANIDVSGRGFKGGIIVTGSGTCGTTDLLVYNKYGYDESFTNSGYKGESPVIRGRLSAVNFPAIFPAYAKGRGSILSGGGGGNGRFSGGGGGSNKGAGGKGGAELNTCVPAPPVEGGKGGIAISDIDFPGTIFMGGGGGSSTYLAGSTASAGGNGGGIVILVCDTLMGNGHSILANGAGASGATGNAGAGGGGGGGSIAIYLQSFPTLPASSALTISASGGKGGDNLANLYGEGGGGGGGLITISNVSIPGNVTRSVAGGAVGQRSGAETGGNGLSGSLKTDYVPTLNGFLFNSIVSSITGTRTDSICSNVVPKKISGTIPVGGSGNYTYLWQKSYNLAGAPADIAGSDVKDYTPAALESDTVWFRRVVTDNITALTDTSKWVQIMVQTAITGNLVGKDTTICYNQNPLSLVPLNAGPSNGNGIYAYRWIENPDNLDWSSAVTAAGTANQASYDPPSLLSDRFYKRVVTSGRCIDQSAAVSITVLPLITGNLTDRPDSVICEGMLFNNLSASAAGGGQTGIYWYQWQDSIASGAWSPASGTVTGTGYSPDTIDFAVQENRYYRRVVWSGPDSVCRSNSVPILLTRYHKIENNLISADTTICSGIVPPALTGSAPLFGSLTYSYEWQDSSKSASWTTRSTSQTPFSPPALTDTTWYRRIVNSSKCYDTSKLIIIKVHKPVISNTISLLSGPAADSTICSSATPNKISGSVPAGGTEIPGDYAYLWYSSTDNFASDNTAIASGGTGKDYQPGPLTATTWFRRKAISGKCESISNAIRIIVLPPITNNTISSNQTVCYNTAPAQLTGPVPDGGDPGLITYIWEESSDGGATWGNASGTYNQQNYNPPALTIPMQYKRIIKSGSNDCCISVSTNIISIGIHALPTGQLVNNADTTICNGGTVNLKLQLTGASPWSLGYNENAGLVTVNGISTAAYVVGRIPNGSASSVSVFNYALSTLTDANGCQATPALLTGTKKATVYRVPVANAGPDDAICGPAYDLKAVPSDGTGTWTWAPAAKVVTPYPAAYNSRVYIDSTDYEAYASVANKFYWEEKNWLCSSKDSVTITFFNRIDPITAGNDTVINSLDFLIQLSATPPRPFETGSWSVVEGTGDFDDNSSAATDVTNVTVGTNKYQWMIINGECSLADIVKVEMFEVFIPNGLSPNDDGSNDSFIIKGLDLRTKPDGTPMYQVADLVILNSAGVKVFSTTNKDGQEWKDWDGTNNSGAQLPEGTYYYLLKMTSVEIPGVEMKYSGFIILKRY